jgi:hypothetical protein
VNRRGGSATQDPDFLEGHPKRKEQEALKANKSSARKSPNENKFKERDEDQEQDTSISDAETEDGNNNEKESSRVNEEPSDNENNEENESDARDDPQPSNKKNERRKYPPTRGKERDPWVQRPIPYPQEVIKSQDNIRFERFIELLKTRGLQISLVDALKMSPYSKYMKDTVRNKRKIPSEAITTMLADYSFEGKNA